MLPLGRLFRTDSSELDDFSGSQDLSRSSSLQMEFESIRCHSMVEAQGTNTLTLF